MRRLFALFLLFAGSFPSFAQDQPRSELKFDILAVDKAADPCADFYQYACGGWRARNPIPPNRSYSAVFQQMRDLNQRRIVDLLQQTADPRPGRSANEQKIGDYYFSCLDEKAIETRGIDPIQGELDRISAIQNKDDLADEIAHLQMLGSDPLFYFYADQRLEDARQVIANVDQSGLNLPEPGYYFGDDAENRKVQAGYREHLQREFKLLGMEPQAASAGADDVLRVESALARASLTPLERRDRRTWYHEMTAAQLQKLVPDFPWQRYFAALDFAPKGPVNVAVPKYFQAVNELMATVPLAAFKNYFRWELVRVATPALPSRFRQAEFDFYSATLRDVKQQDTRAQQCVDLTSRDLGEAVGEVYVHRYFPPETRQRALEMVGRIRQAMQDDFKEIPWISPATRNEALQKLDLLRVMIGYPDRWRDYSKLKVDRGDALGNAFRGQAFEFQRQMAKIGNPVDRGEFYELPQGVEGYHDNPLNVVVFTAGILQPPFFDPGMDDAVNFGLAGAVIGHELSHAFDDKGHLFDGKGDLRNWWTAQDSANYEQRAACFVKQYSNYAIVDDVKVNGELTLGENIADNGGLQLGYRAFESLPKTDAKIDGYTAEQRFFLGWAQWRCMNATDKTARVWARTDEHSPGKWRVNGVVSNMPGFAHAYHCKAGDAMVNPQPCRIW